MILNDFLAKENLYFNYFDEIVKQNLIVLMVSATEKEVQKFKFKRLLWWKLKFTSKNAMHYGVFLSFFFKD